VADLVKQSEKREREVRVGNEYRAAIDFVNSSIDDRNKIRYCALDYSHISKDPDFNTILGEVSSWAVNQTGFFCSDPKWKIDKEGVTRPFTDEDKLRLKALSDETGVPLFPMEQHGVLRTNCIE
jgi:phosphatidylinositol 3,5-bisphosphate 5-phosphatase